MPVLSAKISPFHRLDWSLGPDSKRVVRMPAAAGPNAIWMPPRPAETPNRKPGALYPPRNALDRRHVRLRPFRPLTQHRGAHP